MAEFDITLDGQGYMLVPGSYKSYPDGNLYVDSRLGRQVLTDFTQGMAGPKIGGRNTGPTALYGEASRGAWPAPWPVGFHGIGPAPARVGSGHQTGNTAPKHVVRAGGYVFIASGNELWRWDNASGFTLRYTAPDPIVSATYLMGRIYLAYGEAALTNYWDDVAGVAGPGLPLSHATLLGAIGRRLFMAYADDPTRVTLWLASLGGAGTNEHLDSAPRAVTIYEDSLLIATDRSIYSFRPTGASTRDFTHWGVVSADGLQNDDDFAWFTVFQGRLMAWQGGRAVLYDKQRSWWRHAGLEGQASYGATVVNGWLIASVVPRGGSEPQLWGYNGSGWWLLDAGYGYYPAAARGDRLIAWGEDRKELHYYDMDAGREPVSVGEELTVETALMDAGSPDSAKHWTRIGLELGRPDPAPVGEWGVQLFYSTDAGATWIAAGDEQTVTTPVATVSAIVGVASTYLRIRAVMTRRAGLPPFILAAWSEYEVLNESVRRRRWQFSIAATDRTIDRAGLPDSRDGAAIRTALWELFETSDSFSFTDVDGAVREVRMIGLREEWQRPADVPKLGAHTLCEVVIVEL